MLPIEEILDADVVIAGGGIGGLMAAVAAARAGASTVVLEKANTKRSGSGAGGNDHFACYIPEVHGDLATAEKPSWAVSWAETRTATCSTPPSCAAGKSWTCGTPGEST